MRTLMLAAGVAALAISAPALADPGGKGGGKGQSAKAERGGGKSMKSDRRSTARADRGPQARSDRQRGGGQMRMAATQRGPDKEKARGGGRNDNQKARANRGGGNDRQQIAARGRSDDNKAKGRDRVRDQRVVSRGRDNDKIRVNARDRDQRYEARDRDDRRILRSRDRDDRVRIADRDFDNWWDDRFDGRDYPRGFVDNCPPGLAKKSPACIPPGQAKQWIGQRAGSFGSLAAIPIGLRDLYRDTDDYYYRYGDGYLYRVDRQDNLVSALMPMFGLGLGIGQPFPYNSGYQVPNYYQSFYPSYGNGGDYYRYANGYVYELDGRSGLIENIIPLYDQGYGVGQMLPSSYSYYNLPDPYRSWYTDNDDYYYRYAPGAIYQVDQETQLITAIASLLTGNSLGNSLAIGQQLPMGYSAYNVPYAYRDRYYDTPDSWYRYANGNIYQVDPTTRLITALVSAIV